MRRKQLSLFVILLLLLQPTAIRADKVVELIAARPSGAFLSNVLDLAKWDAALYTDAILKQSTREQMWTPVKLNSGATQPVLTNCGVARPEAIVRGVAAIYLPDLTASVAK